jgi:hypothetical protein
MQLECFLNYFAIRCFRDIADADYVAARLTYRAKLNDQFLWNSLQSLEKYLKCILLLNRIRAPRIGHDLRPAITKVGDGGIALGLTPATTAFIEHVDTYGRFRYREASPYWFGGQLVMLDRAVWELRRFCVPDERHPATQLRKGMSPPKVRLEGGILESIIDDPKNPARGPLLWHNGFFGKRVRQSVVNYGAFGAVNSPLFLYPHFIDAVAEYVFLPDKVQAAYREAAKHRGDGR